jgi:hypothetical protein
MAIVSLRIVDLREWAQCILGEMRFVPFID